jgi:hypothetical protein
MFYFDNREHKTPHIHIEYAEYKALLEIRGGRLLGGDFPNDKLKLALAWVEIHKDELIAIGNWRWKDSKFLR